MAASLEAGCRTDALSLSLMEQSSTTDLDQFVVATMYVRIVALEMPLSGHLFGRRQRSQGPLFALARAGGRLVCKEHGSILSQMDKDAAQEITVIVWTGPKFPFIV